MEANVSITSKEYTLASCASMIITFEQVYSSELKIAVWRLINRIPILYTKITANELNSMGRKRAETTPIPNIFIQKCIIVKKRGGLFSHEKIVNNSFKVCCEWNNVKGSSKSIL